MALCACCTSYWYGIYKILEADNIIYSTIGMYTSKHNIVFGTNILNLKEEGIDHCYKIWKQGAAASYSEMT